MRLQDNRKTRQRDYGTTDCRVSQKRHTIAGRLCQTPFKVEAVAFCRTKVEAADKHPTPNTQHRTPKFRVQAQQRSG